MPDARLPGRPLYLARRSYRRRRMMDAARLLPLLGFGLMLLPLLWTPAGGALGTLGAKIYLFTLWLVLILLAVVLSRVLPREEEDAGDPAGPL